MGKRHPQNSEYIINFSTARAGLSQDGHKQHMQKIQVCTCSSSSRRVQRGQRVQQTVRQVPDDLRHFQSSEQHTYGWFDWQGITSY